LKRQLKSFAETAPEARMARSDLLISLVKAANIGDKRAFRIVTEAIIAEERAKHHDVLADRLTHVIQSNGSGAANSQSISAASESSSRGKDFIAEIIPKRRLEDLILPDTVRRAVKELVEEQQRADLLRAHGVEPFCLSVLRVPARHHLPRL